MCVDATGVGNDALVHHMRNEYEETRIIDTGK